MMRGFFLLFISAVFAQVPTVLHLPSQQSVAYTLRPIATVGVPVTLNLGAPTITALGPAPAVFTVCLAGAGTPCADGCDINFVNIPGAAYVPATGTLTFNVGPWPIAQTTAWTNPITEATGPRNLCIVGGLPVLDNNNRPVQVQANYDCSPANAQGAVNIPAAACTSPERIVALSGTNAGVALAVLLGQTQCCLPVTDAGTPAFGQVVGVCINPNQQSCCGNQPTTAPQQCCSAATAGFPLLSDVQTPCPCGGPGAAPGTLALTCPNGQSCCRRTKFAFNADSFGSCFDANLHQCCETGDVFDPAVQQCCPINGLQSANIPCPCSTDAHCQSSVFPTADGTTGFVRKTMACCRQTAPPVADSLTCSAFDNFPSGIGTVQAQRCGGFCIDLQYQICCNGVACIKEYEKCCNNTCCNTFVGTCATGFRSALGNEFSDREFRVPYEQCSTIEVTTSINVFWIYILPTALLLATLLGFAIALAFANIAARGRLSLLEKMIIFFAIFALLCACLLFFAPVYKYGILTVIVCLLAIITAAARVRWLNIFFIAAVILLLWYIIDPLDGNDYWGVGYRRLPTGRPHPMASGMWHTTRSLWHNITQVNDATNWCVDFYDYFRYDMDLYDTDRTFNPVVTTFGYCSRGWVFALLVMEGFITLSLFLLLLLGLLALLLRFRKMAFAPVELEIVNA